MTGGSETNGRHEKVVAEREDDLFFSPPPPVFLNPLDRLLDMIHGFCSLPSKRSVDRGSVSSNSRDDYKLSCQDSTLVEPSSTSGAENMQGSNSSSPSNFYGFEPIILVHPFDNLKKALQHGFCDPSDKSSKNSPNSGSNNNTVTPANTTSGGSSESRCDNSLMMGTWVSEEASKVSFAPRSFEEGELMGLIEESPTLDDFEETEDDDDAEDHEIVLIGSATKRSVRIARGLELFVVWILVVYAPFHMLRNLNIHLDMELAFHGHEEEKPVLLINLTQAKLHSCPMSMLDSFRKTTSALDSCDS